MIGLEEARSRAIEFWRTRASDPIVLAEVMQRDYGWVFIFRGADEMASGDPMDEVLGLCPVLVLAGSGDVIPLGTADPVEDSLREFEAENRLGGSADR